MSKAGLLLGLGAVFLGGLEGPVRALAQQGRIAGLVTDTLNRRRLAGARVQIEGIDRIFQTDSGGRFIADSIPPGRYQVSFRHPVLDTLAIRASSVVVTVTAGATARAALGVPSGRSFMRLCPAATDGKSRSAIFGMVRSAVTDEPLPGVEVRLSWDDLVVDQTLGVRRQVTVRNATSDSTGRYLACDLPTDVEVKVQASPPGYRVAIGEVTVRSEEAIPLHLSIPPEGVATDAVLTGTVLDSERKPLADADVWVVTGDQGESGVARTDASGNFRLPNLRPGTGMVGVRRVGSQPARRTIALAAGRATPVQFVLPRQIVTLPEVTVEAKAGRAEQAGFFERQAQGFGKYYDPKELERLAAVSVGDVFRQLPAIRLDRGSMGSTALMNTGLGRSATGGTCAMALLVDGMQTPADAIFAMAKEEIDGLEIYDRPERVPVQYQSPITSCGAVLVWTKRR